MYWHVSHKNCCSFPVFYFVFSARLDGANESTDTVQMCLCILTKRARVFPYICFLFLFCTNILCLSARKQSRVDAYTFHSTSQCHSMRFQLANEKSIQSQIIYNNFASTTTSPTAARTVKLGFFQMPMPSFTVSLAFSNASTVFDSHHRWLVEVMHRIDAGEK